MASFQIKPPSEFNFDKPESWVQWIKRFERFRISSDLASKEQVLQVNALIYSMGEKADEILPSFNLTEAVLKV